MLKMNLLLRSRIILLFGLVFLSRGLTLKGQENPNNLPDFSWDFHEGSGTVASAGAGRITGNLAGGAAWVHDPVAGDAINFKKPGSAVLTDTAIHIGNVYTISCWIKASPDRRNNRVIIAGDGTTSSYFHLKLDKNSGQLQFYSRDMPGGVTSGVTVDDNKWHHIAITHARGLLKFYKDGSLVKTGTVNTGIDNGMSRLAIGAMTDRTFSFGGNIAQVRIYRSVLSAVKILNLYTNKLAGWDLGEGMGITTHSDYGNPAYGMLEGPINTYDNFGIANTGRLSGATWATDGKFGNVLNFSVPGSGVRVKNTNNLNLKDRFTISCWVKAPPKRNETRIILAKGTGNKASSYFELKLEPATGRLNFYSSPLTGNINSGIIIDDNKWHHVAVSYGQGVMKFYKDAVLMATNKVSGKIDDSNGPLTIGSLNEGAYSFGGDLAHLNFFGSVLTATQVKDQYYETETAGWNLDEGTGSVIHDKNAGKNNGVVEKAAWVPGKGSSFSDVMNFSAAGSHVVVNSTSINPGNRFTIAAWVQAPSDRFNGRVILAKAKKGAAGHFCLELEPGTGNLSFFSPGLSGDMNSGFRVDDTVWHHIMITYGNGEMKFYKDRQLVKTSTVSGTVVNTTAPLAIGSLVGGTHSFGGNLAQVRIYNAVKTPEDVTHVVPPAGPVLNLKRGIVFDRIQNGGFPVKAEWQISANDIAVAKAAGFDHIKILLTADQFIEGAGTHKVNMSYIDPIVNRALASGLPCVINLHPEPAFKFRYLGSDTSFAQLLGFYKEFSKYLAERWTPKQIAFQLMTEPFGPAGKEYQDWNILYPRMIAAVRTYMPGYTLIMSGNRVGNIYGMTDMIPVNDKNIYYSFTTYEPYRFGFNTQFGAWRGAGAYWKDISYMPWPSSPDIVAARMDKMLAKVKAGDRSKAREDLLIYGNSYFNRQWMFRRAKNVSEWNDSYGGDLQVLVAEFGAIDHLQAKKAGASDGIYPGERLQFVRDMRQSFEAFGMGWEYWSFNEYFTILDPAVRKPYGVASTNILDEQMLSALGLRMLK